MNEIFWRGWGVEKHTVKLSKFLEARNNNLTKKTTPVLMELTDFFVLAAISRIQ